MPISDLGFLVSEPLRRNGFDVVPADGSIVTLTTTDWELLVALVRHRGQVLSQDDLLDLSWNDPQGVGPSRAKFAVLRLRQRLGWDDVTDSPIESVRGFGYRYRSGGTNG